MKDENLRIAKNNGINVPDFVVVKSDEIFFGQSELEKAIDEMGSADFSLLKERLVGIVGRNICFDDEISLDGENFAVRSSCNVEDGGKVSFAGQFATFLNVKKSDVPKKIAECVKSLFSENVLWYALENGIELKKLKMNVIVQKMLEPTFSGVLFTANPQGLLNESVIVVGKGCGDGVVTDRTETSSYYYSLTDRVYYCDGKENYLPEEKINELIELSEKIKKIFKSELLDIEFAIENEEIYVLQIREITTLNAENPLILDNSNIVESYPGICLPLTDSFVNFVYSGVFRGLARRVLKNEKILKKYDAAFGNMVGSANGRMYYKISNWYTVIKFLPLNGKIIPVWQEMLGVKTKSYDNTKVDISFFSRIRTYVNSVYELISVPKNMKKLEKEFSFVNEYFYGKFYKPLSEKELVGLFDEIRDRLLKVWDITLLNDMYSFIFTGIVKSRIKKTNPDDFEKVSGDFISGISNIESMKPIKALAELASISESQRDSKLFEEKYDEYIKLYGDRYLEELKLESKTFRTDNILLDRKIAEYAGDKERLSRLLLSDNSGRNYSKKGFGITFCSKRAMLGIKNREISRLNRSRIFGMVRGIFLRLSDSFVNRGVIERKEDIFYLTIDEVFSLVDSSFDVKKRIEKRKGEYETYKLLPTYSRLIFSEKEFDKSCIHINSAVQHIQPGKLKGIPCSNGTAEGEVLIIRDASKAGNVKGKILVTKMTDPGWVFLLAGASGIIAEKGSLLSHTAIVSREIGIPSVVGAENAMSILHDGDRVRIDGGNGIIEVLR